MVIIQPRIWDICDKCGEWFAYENDLSKKCPECGEGNLVKTCAFCGKAFEECTCSKEELDKRCHVCGASKEKCLCRNNNNNKINNF